MTRLDSVHRRQPVEVKFRALDLKQVTLDGEFEGYASLFNREDLSRDIIVPGAFRATLKQRPPRDIKMLYQHDPAQPIGLWHRIYEDARGLFARGRLMTELARGREILTLMRAGAVDGLSIGFRVVDGRHQRRSGVRHLHTIDLWEISVVTFPMMPDARVSSVKSDDCRARRPSPAEFERWLVRDLGLTRREARAVIGSGDDGFKSRCDRWLERERERLLTRRIAEAARLLRISSEV